jgi:hypothetical protein
MDDVLWLRHALGEEIAEGQTEADTNFMDRDLEDLLAEHSNRNLAAAAGWRRKAGWIARGKTLQSYKVGDESYTYTSAKEAFEIAMDMSRDYESRGSGGSRVFAIARERDCHERHR